MDLKEALTYQLESSAFQVDKVLEGLPADKWEAKLRDDSMSPREAVAHLTECYVASQKEMRGEEHNWGTFAPQATTPDGLLKEMQDERAKAWEAIVSQPGEKAVKAATQFIVLHDAYHVGQLATLRISLDPEWNAYSIYG